MRSPALSLALAVGLACSGCAGSGEESTPAQANAATTVPPATEDRIQAIDTAAQDAAAKIDPQNADAELEQLKSELQDR